MKAGSLRTSNVDLPVALLALGFFLALVFQTVQLVREGGVLAAVDRSQDGPLQETVRLKQNADSLGTDVATLAQSGNVHAKQVVDDMARQNIIMRTGPASEGQTSAPPK
jgi:hypothetical protein